MQPSTPYYVRCSDRPPPGPESWRDLGGERPSQRDSPRYIHGVFAPLEPEISRLVQQSPIIMSSCRRPK